MAEEHRKPNPFKRPGTQHRRVLARHRQDGVALITAMLIVAIIATVATQFALSSSVWIRQAVNRQDRAQADAIRLGAEAYAAWLLNKDTRESQTDDLTEDWATTRTLPIDNGIGAVSVTLIDAQGKLNLNNLMLNDQVQPAYRTVFDRLLESQGVTPNLAEALIDWMDANSQPQPNGAEDLEYLGVDPPYRAANRRLASIDELRLIKGFTRETIDKLRPYVVALPGPTQINFNTAPDVVLAAIVTPALAPSAFADIIKVREQKPFKDINELKQLLPTGSTVLDGVATAPTTQYFYLDVSVKIGRSEQSTRSLIQRPAQQDRLKVLWHAPQVIKIESDGERNDNSRGPAA